MSVLDDAVAALATAIVELDTRVQAEVDALKAALTANDPAAMQAAADSISALTAKVAADSKALADSVPPPAV